MISVKVSAFTKRKNSTKVTSSGTTYSCVLVEPCSITHPVIKLSGVTTAPATYNYAYIATFKRYYFIDDWEADGPFWIAHLSVDVLASFKAKIGALTKYVNYASAAEDEYIRDTRVPVKAICNSYNSKQATIYGSSLSAGVYCMSIINVPSDGTIQTNNGITYAVVSPANMLSFMQQINSVWQQIFDNDYLKYITNVFWLPLDYNDIDGHAMTLSWPVQGVSLSYKDVSLSGRTYVKISSITPDTSPYTADYGAWINSEPWTKYQLRFTPMGAVDLDSTLLYGRTLGIYFSIDLWTGYGHLEYKYQKAGTYIYGGEMVSQLGINVPIAQESFNLPSVGAWGNQVLSSTDSTLETALFAADTVQKAFSHQHQVRSQGTTGTIITIDSQCYLDEYFYEPQERNSNEVGYPLFSERQLSTIAGYIQCADGEHDIAAFDTEKDMISSYLTGGFYYE